MGLNLQWIYYHFESQASQTPSNPSIMQSIGCCLCHDGCQRHWRWATPAYLKHFSQHHQSHNKICGHWLGATSVLFPIRVLCKLKCILLLSPAHLFKYIWTWKYQTRCSAFVRQLSCEPSVVVYLYSKTASSSRSSSRLASRRMPYKISPKAPVPNKPDNNITVPRRCSEGRSRSQIATRCRSMTYVWNRSGEGMKTVYAMVKRTRRATFEQLCRQRCYEIMTCSMKICCRLRAKFRIPITRTPFGIFDCSLSCHLLFIWKIIGDCAGIRR